MQIQEQMIAEIAKEVVARLRIQMQLPERPAAKAATPAFIARDGVFATVNEAASAAYEAQKKVARMSLEDRGRMIEIVRRICNDRRSDARRGHERSQRLDWLVHH
jgi:hypothetical protein